MTQPDGYRCEGRWKQCLRLAVVALFVAWSFAGALHAPALAAASDGTQAVAAHQLDPDTTDHAATPGHACAAQGHCSGAAILPARLIAGTSPGTLRLPRMAHMAPLASIAPVDRPPILSVAA